MSPDRALKISSYIFTVTEQFYGNGPFFLVNQMFILFIYILVFIHTFKSNKKKKKKQKKGWQHE